MRSIPLEALLSALNFPGLRFLNLQYANVDKELSLLDASLRDCLLHHRDIDLTKNLDGVAGLIEACDLVISVGNAVAHLSGALGQRTWVLLPQVAGWRWLHGSTNCGWYESVRLFRQERRGDWDGVLSDLRAAIDHEIRRRQ
jgi:ADP-heptose:LPS heptosyltransferase